MRVHPSTTIVSYLISSAMLMGCDALAPQEVTPFRPPSNPRVVLLGTPAAAQWSAIQRGAGVAGHRYPDLHIDTLEFQRDDLTTVVSAAVAKKPNAIALWIDDPALAAGPAESIVTSGIPLITIGLRVNSLGVFGHVETDLEGAAELLGRSAEQVAGLRTFVLLHESGRSPLASRLYQRFKLGLRSAHGARLLDERNAGVEVHSPVALVSEMITRYRSATLVFSLTAAPWRPPRPSGLSGVQFVTLPASAELWPALQNDEALALAGPIDGEIGQHAIDLCYRAIIDPTDTGAQRSVKSELVTKQTLADFQARYQAAIGE